MPNIDQYMERYNHEHTSPWNRLLHGIGIPLIFAGLVLLILTHWQLGLILFVGGWVLLFVGHRIEGNNPAFFQGPIYFLVGPLWVLKEIKDLVLGKPSATADATAPPSQESAGADAALSSSLPRAQPRGAKAKDQGGTLPPTPTVH